LLGGLCQAVHEKKILLLELKPSLHSHLFSNYSWLFPKTEVKIKGMMISGHQRCSETCERGIPQTFPTGAAPLD
jgi:hypothetical protein